MNKQDKIAKIKNQFDAMSQADIDVASSILGQDLKEIIDTLVEGNYYNVDEVFLKILLTVTR